ncbi:MAG: isoleucine--tRNA ligase [Proteobacteria bacterium]|nr:isoleucine--tRNA ligase [Pseudomonadota bacterium]
MFDPVTPEVSFPSRDKQWLAFWEQEQIFRKSVEARSGGKTFVFYEGPPTANGKPHPGHVLTRVMKDVTLRYRAMCGHYVSRRAGWDTHGLPVEVEVEKDLGIHGRFAIENYGVEAFTRRCIESVFKYIEEWRQMTRQIGFWIDLDNAYVTFHRKYVESVWWALKTLFDKGLLYQDRKVLWWWPQGGTALSSHEVGLGYKSVEDPSIVVRFRLRGQDNTSLLAWTTTPWTLPSNVALAVHPSEPYVTAQLESGEKVILARALLGKLLANLQYRVLAERPGRDLAGCKYEPVFSFKEPQGGPAHVVVADDFVSMDTGSGMVHIAPAFGEDDFRVCRSEGLGFLQLIGPDGNFLPEAGDFAGRFCKEADREIVRNLRGRGLLFSEERYRHDYPFCWRSMDDPLIQYARSSWFIRTTREIDRIIENNQGIHWEPDHIRDGRFGSFLSSNVDWALSRERFWGTPLPIWVNDETGAMEAVASWDDVLSKNPDGLDVFERALADDPNLSEHLLVHKPWIDAITWTKAGEPGVYRRVPEVVDCWFDSGCMPFAQWGYPAHNREVFAAQLPADFITEAIDQTRGWFYSLLAISTLLFPERPYPHPYRNCVVLGLISDEKGHKLSKSRRNYADPLAMIERQGADAVRWALCINCVPGQNMRFYEGAASEALREFLLKLWNVYSFFVTYANIDGWDPSKVGPGLGDRPVLDRWIMAELDAAIGSVRAELDAYRTHIAARRLVGFVDALSNWYVRRSRSRFWAAGDGDDKHAAFATLYEVLVTLAKVLAPFTPFLGEDLYQNLVRRRFANVPESVHLTDFPEPLAERRNETLREDVRQARLVVTLGQRVRAQYRLRVRQPLGHAFVIGATPRSRSAISQFSDAIREELNVHELAFTREPTRYVEFQILPDFRKLGPRLGNRMPECKTVLAAADAASLYSKLQVAGEVEIELSNGPLRLCADEIEVRLAAKAGFAAAASGPLVVVLDTKLTDELRREGLAREVVNRVQRARKTRKLAYEARIALACEASEELAHAIEEHREYICGETLCDDLRIGWSDAAQGERHEAHINEQAFAFRLRVLSEAG